MVLLCLAMMVLYILNWFVFQEILKEGRDIQPLNTDYGSEISSQSEFMSSNRPING